MIIYLVTIELAAAFSMVQKYYFTVISAYTTDTSSAFYSLLTPNFSSFFNTGEQVEFKSDDEDVLIFLKNP